MGVAVQWVRFLMFVQVGAAAALGGPASVNLSANGELTGSAATHPSRAPFMQARRAAPWHPSDRACRSLR